MFLLKFKIFCLIPKFSVQLPNLFNSPIFCSTPKFFFSIPKISIPFQKEWLDKCDQAKKLRLSQENSTETADKQKHEKPEAIAPSRSMSLDSNTLGNEDGEESESFEPIPEWLMEVAEDLDSCMAQRHFEEAYGLLEKAKTYLNETQLTPELNEIKTKVNERGRSLVDFLTRELELSAEAKSLQGGGLRSARRAVRLLIQLDRSAQACQLYLQLCSAALKARLKKVKREGATIPYVNQLSAIAFSNIVDMAREFLKLFPESTNCTSGNRWLFLKQINTKNIIICLMSFILFVALVVWCSQEVKHLTSHLIKQLFIPQVTMSTLVECIGTVRSHCDQVRVT